jgi:uncharacterized protein
LGLLCASAANAQTQQPDATRFTPTFPALTGRVVDDANLLDSADKQALTNDLKALEDKTSDQVVVVTVPSLQGYAIEDYGLRLGNHWGINNGVLLIVAPNERKVRIEVARGLEATLTNALSKIIIDNAILPHFRVGDFGGGIKDGVRDITLALMGDAAEVERRMPDAASTPSVQTQQPNANEVGNTQKPPLPQP